MNWVEVAIVFFASHQVGDFLLQTDWQAIHKRGGLGHNSVARRALVSHVATYTLAFVPALIWIAASLGAWTLAIAVLIALPHLIQDDRRLLEAYIRSVKHAATEDGTTLEILVDQAFHFVALLPVALLVQALS